MFYSKWYRVLSGFFCNALNSAYPRVCVCKSVFVWLKRMQSRTNLLNKHSCNLIRLHYLATFLQPECLLLLQRQIISYIFMSVLHNWYRITLRYCLCDIKIFPKYVMKIKYKYIAVISMDWVVLHKWWFGWSLGQLKHRFYARQSALKFGSKDPHVLTQHFDVNKNVLRWLISILVKSTDLLKIMTTETFLLLFRKIPT